MHGIYNDIKWFSLLYMYVPVLMLSSAGIVAAVAVAVADLFLPFPPLDLPIFLTSPTILLLNEL